MGNLKSQIVISSWGGLRRATPYAFTEQGVAMLSSVLWSKRAVQVNVEIVRRRSSHNSKSQKFLTNEGCRPEFHLLLSI